MVRDSLTRGSPFHVGDPLGFRSLADDRPRAGLPILRERLIREIAEPLPQRDRLGVEGMRGVPGVRRDDQVPVRRGYH